MEISTRPTSASAPPTRELRAIEAPFALGQVLLDHAEVLYAAGRDDDAAPLRAETITIFERLRATPWLQRARALGNPGPSMRSLR